jgi:hypothetical protein
VGFFLFLKKRKLCLWAEEWNGCLLMVQTSSLGRIMGVFLYPRFQHESLTINLHFHV